MVGDKEMAYPVYLVMTKQDILLNNMFTIWGQPVAAVAVICTSGNLPQELVCNSSNTWLNVFCADFWNFLF